MCIRDSQTVDAEFVFNMALEKSEDQLDMIQTIISTVQDSEFLGKARNMTLDELYQSLYRRWSAAGILG